VVQVGEVIALASTRKSLTAPCRRDVVWRPLFDREFGGAAAIVFGDVRSFFELVRLNG
jgi:hypothetical protein